MADYAPPLTDMRFVLEQVVDLAALAELDAFSHADPEAIFAAIEEASRFLTAVVAPLNRVGDTVGSTLGPDGKVSTPPGFGDAYRKFAASGWGAAGLDRQLGGGGFPWVVAMVIQEMLTSANMAFSLCPLLNRSAIEALIVHGTPAQHGTYLEKMISGQWTATMDLTEAEAGSDLGAVRTRAVPAAEGTWRITGQKKFISYGEHDLADNIVHLVLARVPGAPPGTKGISCFIVPKYLVEPDGTLGARNDLRCVSVEHKLGIRASPACTMSYGDNGGAVGYLVGEVNAGMRFMFTMMSSARLSVGLGGLAIAERSYQAALIHAQQRRQGRPRRLPASEPVPIVAHPDVRRMLLSMKACIEAMRCLIYAGAAAIDVARHHPDPRRRQTSQELVDLLTPVSKAWCSDLGVRVASLAIQVHGGVGYVEDTGVAQHFRDSRIAPIYEGTNGIQAIDLVLRKLPMRGGGVVKDLLAQMDALDGVLRDAGEDLTAVRTGLARGVEVLRRVTDWMLEHAAISPNDALAGATPYLSILGLVTGGWLLARSALAAHRELGDDDDGFLAAKVATAAFYCQQLLPEAAGLAPAATAGAAPLYRFDLAATTLG